MKYIHFATNLWINCSQVERKSFPNAFYQKESAMPIRMKMFLLNLNEDTPKKYFNVYLTDYEITDYLNILN